MIYPRADFFINLAKIIKGESSSPIILNLKIRIFIYGERVAALVIFMSVVTFNPHEFDLVLVEQGEQLLPQVNI